MQKSSLKRQLNVSKFLPLHKKENRGSFAKLYLYDEYRILSVIREERIKGDDPFLYMD